MARMKTSLKKQFPNTATFLAKALPAVAANSNNFAKFRTWSGLNIADANKTLKSFNSSPWIDIGEIGRATDGTQARGVFDKKKSSRVRIATDIAIEFEQNQTLKKLQRLLEKLQKNTKSLSPEQEKPRTFRELSLGTPPCP